MRAREAGIIGGGVTVALVAVLASFVTVGQALAIEDQQGSPLDLAPVVVGTAPPIAPLAVPVPEHAPAQPAEPEPIVVEAVTAPEPRSAVPGLPAADAAQQVPPAAPPAVQAPQPAPPAEPQRPSKADLKRWIENRSIDEARAWASAHGWTEEHIRAALREYAHHFEGRQ